MSWQQRRYENTERRATEVAEKGIKYIGMGVSGGEEGARNGAHLHAAWQDLCVVTLRSLSGRGPCPRRVDPRGDTCDCDYACAGPSMMPGGDKEAYKALEPIVSKVAAQVNS